MKLRFILLPGRYAIVRLGPAEPVPDWPRGDFVSVTRTPAELSIVCADSSVPDAVNADRNWRCLALDGTFPLDTTGIAAAFTSVLAGAGVSVFVISTGDTDYVLIRASAVPVAVEALGAAGFEVRGE
jgi:hypothetical protein